MADAAPIRAGSIEPMTTHSPGDGAARRVLPPPRTDDATGLTAADVMHAEVEILPASVTVGELRAWFSVSRSRRLAVVGAHGRYRASFTPADVPPGAPADTPALELARGHPTVRPEMPAPAARDLVIATDARRVPVVDAAGHVHGVLAVTTDLQFFACRPQPVAD
jgi:CBS-domain-containing membrane protein